MDNKTVETSGRNHARSGFLRKALSAYHTRRASEVEDRESKENHRKDASKHRRDVAAHIRVARTLLTRALGDERKAVKMAREIGDHVAGTYGSPESNGFRPDNAREALTRAVEAIHPSLALEALRRHESAPERTHEAIAAKTRSRASEVAHAHALGAAIHHDIAHYHDARMHSRLHAADSSHMMEGSEHEKQADHDHNIEVAGKHHALEGAHTNTAAWHAGLSKGPLSHDEHEKAHAKADSHARKLFGNPTDHDYDLEGAHRKIAGISKFLGTNMAHHEAHPFRDETA